MPGFGLDSGQDTAIGSKKAESGSVRRQPGGERPERSGIRIFLGAELHTVPWREGIRVNQVDIGTPVMAAGTRNGRPPKNGSDAFRRRQLRCVDGAAGRVLQRPFAAELAIPDGKLTIEIAKSAHGPKVEAVRPRGSVQVQERRNRMNVQGAGRVGHGDDMRSSLPGQFLGIHGAASRAAANSATWSRIRTMLDGSWAPASVY